MTEAQLIRQACEGEGSAVRALYERYAPRVYAGGAPHRGRRRFGAGLCPGSLDSRHSCTPHVSGGLTVLDLAPTGLR